MRVEVRLCGTGGQGLILAGEILGRAAVYEGLNAVETESYGAEARGTAAKSEVIISDKKIGFPQALKCDVLVAMSQDALDSNIKDLRGDGLLLVEDVDSERIPKWWKGKTVSVPATRTAEQLFGKRILANVVMLGVLVKTSKLVKADNVERAIEETVNEEYKGMNVEAFRRGMELKAVVSK